MSLGSMAGDQDESSYLLFINKGQLYITTPDKLASRVIKPVVVNKS